MKKTLILAIIMFSAAIAQATVSFAIDMLDTRDALGGPLSPTTSTVLLIASGNDAIWQANVGTALLAQAYAQGGAIAGSDDVILAILPMTGSGTAGWYTGLAIVTLGTYSGSTVGLGDPIALIWLPDTTFTGTSSVTIGASANWGWAQGTNGLDGSNAWTMPADGTSGYPLAIVTVSQGGGTANSMLYANYTVPEPSTYAAIMGLVMLGVAYIRRRK